MREITVEDYKRADRQLERQQARRGFTIHYGLRWVDKAIGDRQARIEQRAAATKRAA